MARGITVFDLWGIEKFGLENYMLYMGIIEGTLVVVASIITWYIKFGRRK